MHTYYFIIIITPTSAAPSAAPASSAAAILPFSSGDSSAAMDLRVSSEALVRASFIIPTEGVSAPAPPRLKRRVQMAWDREEAAFRSVSSEARSFRAM